MGGVVGGTLGSCQDAPASCVSTYDDRPGRFAPPWELPDVPPAEAFAALLDALRADGALVLRQSESPLYVYAYQPRDAIHVEVLLLTEGDSVALVRAAAAPAETAASLLRLLPDRRAEKALTSLRRRVGWAEVPVLRNRIEPFGGVFGESPFDSFGPPPPEGGVDDLSSLDDP